MMFESLRDAFRQAVINFKEELHRDEPTADMNRLLRAMRGEVEKSRNRIRELKTEIRSALREAEREGEESLTCRRRERMAQEIGDRETAEIASEYARRHERRKAILERKALTLKEELDLQETEVQEMVRRLRIAESRSRELVARRARSREGSADGDDLFDELDRMADRSSRERRRREAYREIEEALDPSGGPDATDPFDALEVEARLRELKRRMGLG